MQENLLSQDNRSGIDGASGPSPLAVLSPLVPRYGVRCSLEEFQAAVNLVFHDIEAEVYDDIHQDMWLSLPRQYELLAADVMKLNPAKPLRMLDIGCGTGLSSELLMRTQLGAHIGSLHLIDTSPKMLGLARKRLSAHPLEIRETNGFISGLTEAGSFDVILTCSVLHHIPDLPAFLADVRRLQRPGGVFLHLQDPNADAIEGAALQQRTQAYEAWKKPLLPKPLQRLRPSRAIPAIWRRVTGTQPKSYLERVNDELLKRGVIAKPMAEQDIWAVTDIRIFSGEGVSASSLAENLPGYRNVSTRTYAFFSVLASSLPPKMAKEEESLIDAGSRDGSYLAAAWQLEK
ncbi:MAG: class I SAM-dependent methyltransferase [Bryobacteraceae bacterium]